MKYLSSIGNYVNEQIELLKSIIFALICLAFIWINFQPVSS